MTLVYVRSFLAHRLGCVEFRISNLEYLLLFFSSIDRPGCVFEFLIRYIIQIFFSIIIGSHAIIFLVIWIFMHTGLWTKKLHNIKAKNRKSWRFSIQNLGFLFCTNLKNFACLLFLFISTFSIGTTWTFILWMVRFETICWRFPSFSILCSNLDTIFWIWTQYTCLVCLNIDVFLYDLSKVYIS